MTRIGKIEIGWNGLLATLADHISAWRPATLEKETEYSRALATHLRQTLPVDTHVENEYRHLGETLDVYVKYSDVISNDEIFIEVKRRLNRKSEFNRLVGQVTSLDPAKSKVLVVLIGNCDVELIGRLRLQFKQHLEQGPLIMNAPTMSVVHVPEANIEA